MKIGGIRGRGHGNVRLTGVSGGHHSSTETLRAEHSAQGLKPRSVRYLKLSTNPRFAGKLRDAAGLYVPPPERPFVLLRDETLRGGAWLDRQPRIIFDFVSAVASWLNLVERFFSQLAQRRRSQPLHAKGE